MGWSWSQDWEHRKDIIADLTKDENNKNYAIKESKPTYSIRKCVKHCFRGNNFSGVLWTVWDIFSHNVETNELIKTDRYIGCDLLSYYKTDKCWGYKGLCESSHPFYYSCPLGYLDITPVVCEKWREQVRQYHTERKVGFKIKAEDILLLKEGYNPRIMIVRTTRPLRGIAHGILYRLPRKAILRKITDEEKMKAKEAGVQRILKMFPQEKDKENEIREKITFSGYDFDESDFASTAKKETIVL